MSMPERVMVVVIAAALCIISFLFLSVASFQPGAIAAQNELGGLITAYADDAPYRNAMYLYLRLAGVVWIVVEWIAAFILWRGYRVLARVLQEKRCANDT